ncbi:MAG: beta-galactosidase [Prevotella sp.]|nr:beta-galactosidase [Prevotella sp.]
MQRIYQEVRTPYKYGMVVAPTDNYHKIDCPTVFQQDGKWYMTYVVYNGKEGLDGRGYETWLAESDDLLHWTTKGRILSYKDDGWDMNQRGGFPALIDWTWGGSYKLGDFKGRHWMTYIGGHGTGYEAVREPLNIGLAWTQDDITQAHEWQSDDKPLISIDDKEAQWWEKLTEYKSTIYEMRNEKGGMRNALPKELAKYRFVMFYNAGGVNPMNNLKAERIGIALSNDLKKWKRYQQNPVYFHESPGIITGDAQIVKMKDCFVMFYFSAYNPQRRYNAYNTFAVSRDLIHWQDWEGEDLIWPTKSYDEMFAHKSYVVKHDGVVYHFYCAVNNDQQRGIAVATSVPMGRSEVRFPKPESKGRRVITSLNEGWIARCSAGRDTIATDVTIPHNFDDYYGYRQLRHGNLHGKATYSKVFQATKNSDKRYFLQFEGVGTYATVTLNGHQYPEELVGRTVWTLDITDRMKDGDNHLRVDVDHPAMQTASPWVCGGCSSEWGFSEGSQPFGIFRPVSLIETDAVRIEPFGVHIWNNAQCDSVYIETEVKNYTEHTQTFELVNKFTLASGKQVFRHAEIVTLRPGGSQTLRHAEPIADAHRWSLDNPYLYNLVTMIKRNEKTTDEVRTPYGIRSVSWPVFRKDGDNRFLLNGQPVFINGTCEYEHLLGASHAFSPEQIRSRIKQITNAGFNALREAHQPHDLLYQQLCDQQGILFWSQFSAHIWYDTNKFRKNFKSLLVRWIKERRNSPSVILWGLQNESVLPKKFAEECCDIIRQLDPTCADQRAITTCNGGEGSDWNVIQNWSGTYGGSAENYDNELKQPEQLLNGEYGAWRTIDLHGNAKYSEESFTKLLETKARLAESAKESVCGHFQWIFNSHDNPGRVQPDGAYRRIDKIGPINYKGLVTAWEEPTPAYYMYRQRYYSVSRFDKATNKTAADRNRDLMKAAEGYHYLYRINCGGDAFTDEFGQQWLSDDTIYSHSWGQDFEGIRAVQASQRHITADIRGTQSDELFQFFRFGRHRLWYDLPVADGDYRVELYFVEPWHGKDAAERADYEGLRIFDVDINGRTVVDDLDPWAEAGYCGSLKRVVAAKAKNGRLHISFPEVKAGQAIICGIAVAAAKPVAVAQQPATTSWRTLDTDTIAKLPQEELPKDTEARPASTYKFNDDGTFIITPGLGQEYALRFRYKNTTGEPVTARMTITDSKRTVLVDCDVTFPPTPNKFKMLSTTTGTQINAGIYTVRIDTKDVEFKELEIQ